MRLIKTADKAFRLLNRNVGACIKSLNYKRTVLLKLFAGYFVGKLEICGAYYFVMITFYRFYLLESDGLDFGVRIKAFGSICRWYEVMSLH